MNEKYTAGTTPQPSDTKRQLWAKLLTLFGQVTGDAAHPPLQSDSQRVLIVKILKTLNHV